MKNTAQSARTKPKAVRFMLQKTARKRNCVLCRAPAKTARPHTKIISLYPPRAPAGKSRAGECPFLNGQPGAALRTARIQYPAAAAAAAAGQKTVRNGAVALFGLECTFHNIFLLIVRQNHNIL